MKQLINEAIKELYSEQFDFKLTLQKLSGGNEGADLLRACIAINTASTIVNPLTEADINNALQELEELMPLSRRLPDLFKKSIWLYQEQAELNWLEKTEKILKGKLAYKNDKYSYDGAIYFIENKKGPASKLDKEKFQKLAAELNSVNKAIKDHLEK